MGGRVGTSREDRLRTARPVAQLRAGRRDWYRIQTKADNKAEITIYDEIGYWGITASDFMAELKALDATELSVRINSPGGEVWDGLAIYNSLKDHPATVTTYVDGYAASAASLILQAGDHRVAAKASQVMIHDGWGMAIGGADDMRAMADLLDQTNGMLAQLYADRAGGNADYWRTAMKAETWYTGTEAATANLVDEVSGNTEDPEMAASAWDLTIFNFAGRSKAPIPAPIPAPPAVPEWDPALILNAVKGALHRG